MDDPALLHTMVWIFKSNYFLHLISFCFKILNQEVEIIIVVIIESQGYDDQIIYGITLDKLPSFLYTHQVPANMRPAFLSSEE